MKKIIISSGRLSAAPAESVLHGSVLTIGCFDGIHLGHQKLIREVKSEANRLAAKSCLCLLDPHPRKALSQGANFKRLLTVSETESVLSPLGLDYFGIIPFTPAFSRLSPEEFIRSFVKPRLNPKAIVAGYDFSFGLRREGSVSLLRRLGEKWGFSARQIPPVLYGGKPVSSSRVRKALSLGRAAEAKELLGRPFSLHGPVIKGAGRGRKLGFPTANLQLKDKFLPRKGVYAARAKISKAMASGRWEKAVANIGDCPTFSRSSASPEGRRAALVEAHILPENSDFREDLYGAEMDLELICFLREERAFPGPSSLAKQIKKDIQKTLNSY